MSRTKDLIHHVFYSNLMKRILFITLAFFMSFAVMAQENEEWFGHDVEGFCIGQRMNYKQFVAKFGKPDRYEANGGDESYYIGEDYFHFGQDGLFLDFVLESPRFAALTKYIKGGIRVGDKLSKLDNFKYGKPIKARETLQPDDGSVTYVLFYNTDCPLYLDTKDGKITIIYYWDPD